jgi:hypothetical protein
LTKAEAFPQVLIQRWETLDDYKACINATTEAEFENCLLKNSQYRSNLPEVARLKALFSAPILPTVVPGSDYQLMTRAEYDEWSKVHREGVYMAVPQDGNIVLVKRTR